MAECIAFSGQTSRKSVEDLLEGLQRTSGKRMVTIDSPGGSFEFFSVLGPALKRTGYISVGTSVRSAAIFLQLLGRQRLALPGSTFFFHDVRAVIGKHGEVTVFELDEFLQREKDMKKKHSAQTEVMQEWIRRMQVAQRWMLSFVQQETGLSPGVFADLMKSEVTLTAKEAVRYGVVHRIVSEDELMRELRR